MRTAEEFARRWGGHVPGLLGARRSYAVLCPLVESRDGLSLLFEVRAAALGRQPGETCFPGGMAEPGEDARACALRETREELAIPAEEITLLGPLDFICSPAGYLIQPVLGLVSAAGLADMRPSAAEVAETFTVPVSFFADTAPETWTYALEPVPPENFPYDEVGIPADYRWGRGCTEVPVWRYGGHVIWGMTGRMVKTLVSTE